MAEENSEQSVAVLAEQLARARRDGSVFELPADSRHWLDLRYDHPDTGYALALVLVWSYAVTGLPGGTVSDDHVAVATWQLRHFLPPSAQGTLADIEHALLQYRQSTGVHS
ncbi:hypothetical protein [Micromonospora sp. KLBMP9576]|uniref:hypothetical protein n=1 Tax=Micromonospora sp. KLBMP9576 TaxID=3424769 RepID=UPI003D8BDCC0